MDWNNENNGNENWYQEEGNFQEDIQNSDINNKQDEIKPVNLPKKKTMIFAIAFFLTLMLVSIVGTKACSMGTSKKSSNSVSIENTVTDKTDTAQNTVENQSENLENQGVSIGVGNSSSEKSVSSEKEEVVKENSIGVQEETVQKEDNIEHKEDTKEGSIEEDSYSLNVSEVSEPVLGDVLDSSAMVLSKKIYSVNNESYAYAVNLALLIGSDETVTVRYFCPKKTYDALGMGDNVVVQYQVDSSGIISIGSVSK